MVLSIGTISGSITFAGLAISKPPFFHAMLPMNPKPAKRANPTAKTRNNRE